MRGMGGMEIEAPGQVVVPSRPFLENFLIIELISFFPCSSIPTPPISHIPPIKTLSFTYLTNT